MGTAYPMTNAEKINAWRGEKPGARITEAILREILNLETLARADLTGTDLYGADLRGADLTGTDLRGADLTGTNLRGTNLRGTNLRGTNLRGAKLNYANLCSSSGGVLTFRAGASGDGYLKPTPDGWRIRVGCWHEKTLEDLDDLIHGRAEWPVAEGSERNRRRPMLIAVKALCEAWIGQHPGIITNLDKIWNTK